MGMNETELCESFREELEQCGCVVHAETSGFDMLVIGPNGIQIGVEAKTRPNVDVLAQALDRDYWPGHALKGPDYRSVLVPRCGARFRAVASALRVVVWRAGTSRYGLNNILSAMADPFSLLAKKMAWTYPVPCWVPELDFKLRAGVPSPRSVTPWKIKAVKLCLRLRDKGYVTSLDFNDVGLPLTEFWRLRLRNYGRVKLNGRSYVKYVDRGGPELPDVKNPEIVQGLAAA